jgi:hypothetical protein
VSYIRLEDSGAVEAPGEALNLILSKRFCIAALGLLILGAVLVAYAEPADAAELSGQPIPAGMVAAHMVGKMVTDADGRAELIGYFPFLEGIAGELFSRPAEPSERTAYFTFRSTLFRSQVLRNDPLLHMRAIAVDPERGIVLRVYRHATPDAEFSRPDSFSQGTLVAEYRAQGGLTTIFPFTATINTGSFRRVNSVDFSFGEQTYNFEALAENITVELKGAPLDLVLAGGNAAVPFGGTAIAAAAAAQPAVPQY